MAELCAFVRVPTAAGVLMQVTSCMGTNGDEVTSALEQQHEPCGSYKQPRCCLYTWGDGARLSRGGFQAHKKEPLGLAAGLGPSPWLVSRVGDSPPALGASGRGEEGVW